MNHLDIRTHLADDVRWTDAAGNTILHYAAETGEVTLVQLCLDEGVDVLAHNKNNEYASDTARSWGYDEIFTLLDGAMKKARAANPAPSLAYATLQEVRDQSVATGTNIFAEVAARGTFEQLTSLATKDPEGFNVLDFLGQAPDGETVLFKICQRGQLQELLKPELWAKNPASFLAVWEEVPKIYQKEHDIEPLLSRIRQMKLKSIALRPPGKSAF